MAKEFSDESHKYNEYGMPECEYDADRRDSAPEEAFTGHEYVTPEEEPAHKKRKKRKRFPQREGVLVMQTAAAVMAVVVMKDAFGYDILKEDPFNDYSYGYSVTLEPAEDVEEIEDIVENIPEPESEPVEVVETKPLDEADSAFPHLPNLDPNGFVPGYGVLNEEYVRIEHPDGTVDYLYCTDGMWNRTNEWWIDSEGVHFDNGIVIKDYYYAPNSNYETESAKITGRAGSSWYNGYDFLWIDYDVVSRYGSLIEPLYKTLPIESVPGASYDEATNTLTLNNFSGDYLNVNLMGNGFKINLIGDNKLTGLLAWGFMYGGSVTLTGDGSLTINNPGSPGIYLKCESSESCLMIDKDVTLNITGKDAAVWIEDSTHGKGIYYLSPLELKTQAGAEAQRMTINQSGDSYYTFADEDSQIITSIRIEPKKED
ncbi:MAG: hypothetical protein J5487_08290 [Lachnospiraceae bacterium]|nr:hypothetical protein [Lachnospiraceae bacterium]